jgi:hypothetical protein
MWLILLSVLLVVSTGLHDFIEDQHKFSTSYLVRIYIYMIWLMCFLFVCFFKVNAGASGPNWSSGRSPPLPYPPSNQENPQTHPQGLHQNQPSYSSQPNQGWNQNPSSAPMYHQQQHTPPPPAQSREQSFPSYGSYPIQYGAQPLPGYTASSSLPYGPPSWSNPVNRVQQEEDMITEMLRRFPPGSLDKLTVKRFLVARDWEMTRATQLLHEYLNWRKSFGCPVDPRSCLTELMKGKVNDTNKKKEKKEHIAFSASCISYTS